MQRSPREIIAEAAIVLSVCIGAILQREDHGLRIIDTLYATE